MIVQIVFVIKKNERKKEKKYPTEWYYCYPLFALWEKSLKEIFLLLKCWSDDSRGKNVTILRWKPSTLLKYMKTKWIQGDDVISHLPVKNVGFQYSNLLEVKRKWNEDSFSGNKKGKSNFKVNFLEEKLYFTDFSFIYLLLLF